MKMIWSIIYPNRTNTNLQTSFVSQTQFPFGFEKSLFDSQTVLISALRMNILWRTLFLFGLDKIVCFGLRLL